MYYDVESNFWKAQNFVLAFFFPKFEDKPTKKKKLTYKNGRRVSCPASGFVELHFQTLLCEPQFFTRWLFPFRKKEANIDLFITLLKTFMLVN